MIDVVHLVWAPLGPEPLRDFLRSYHAHSSGADHQLTILLNGAGAQGPAGGLTREELLDELKETEHRLIALPKAMLDLPAYGTVARLLQGKQICVLNSYCVVLADGWLGLLADALEAPGVGLVGASGSWESQSEWIRGRVRHWPKQILTLPRSRGDYPRFPNPHLRTSMFMLDRDRLLEMNLQSAADKRATYLLESGPRSITRRVIDQGMRPVVVGRDGRSYDISQWPASRTFRSGEQENLLIADNQTRHYQTASPRYRRQLSRDSWGTKPSGSGMV